MLSACRPCPWKFVMCSRGGRSSPLDARFAVFLLQGQGRKLSWPQAHSVSRKVRPPPASVPFSNSQRAARSQLCLCADVVFHPLEQFRPQVSQVLLEPTAVPPYGPPTPEPGTKRKGAPHVVRKLLVLRPGGRKVNFDKKKKPVTKKISWGFRLRSPPVPHEESA